MTTTITPITATTALRTAADGFFDTWLDLITVDLTLTDTTAGPFGVPTTLDWGQPIAEDDGAAPFPAAWYDRTPAADLGAWLTLIATAR